VRGPSIAGVVRASAAAVKRTPANARAVDVLRRSGLLDPGLVAADTAATARWGPSIVVPFAAAALRFPRTVAVVDAERAWTYRELDAATDRVAHHLRRGGWLERDDRVGLLAGNSGWFVVGLLGAAKAGADVVLLNTGFGAEQLGQVLKRESVTVVIADPALVPDGVTTSSAVRWLSTTAGGDGESDLATLGRSGMGGRVTLPRPAGRPILLTSGTTGTPKGARRERVRPDLAAATGVLERIPLGRGDVVVIPSPLFHAWGFTLVLLTAALAGTVVLDGPFDPRGTLRAIERHRADVLGVVPIMLQRMVAALEDTHVDLSSLRVVASSGSALPGPLALRWMDLAGDNLYNLYGSTEVGQVAIATPADLRAAPDTAGRPLNGVSVRLFDDKGHPVPPGGTGRIAARSSVNFDGYTGGGSKEVLDGHMATGDIGRFDQAGRLSVLGRDDDMIVSGGENVYPAEVEDLLAARPEVAEVAVVGAPDEEFGQRLVAFVVPRAGAEVDPEALRQEVRSRLARHKVPREVRVVDELPRTTTGKILRRDLQA
jgi:acyl-CoA synthetase (AMP-forming)/AMP-acid ligase II